MKRKNKRRVPNDYLVIERQIQEDKWKPNYNSWSIYRNMKYDREESRDLKLYNKNSRLIYEDFS